MQREKQPKIYLEIYFVFQGRMATMSQVFLRHHKQERCPWRGSIRLLIWHRHDTAHSLHINEVKATK